MSLIMWNANYSNYRMNFSVESRFLCVYARLSTNWDQRSAWFLDLEERVKRYRLVNRCLVRSVAFPLLLVPLLRVIRLSLICFVARVASFSICSIATKTFHIQAVAHTLAYTGDVTFQNFLLRHIRNDLVNLAYDSTSSFPNKLYEFFELP